MSYITDEILILQDKSGIPWWLGLSHKGISLYDFTDKKTPRRVSKPVYKTFQANDT